jgi:(R,R)-butanediol dehydrogenase/meso-butanediol dehydrogenase/diacetyl reductase
MTVGSPPDMAAAVYQGPGHLEVERRPVPSPGSTEVLIEVSHCGVCGTDLHAVLDGWGMVGTVGGHEYSGIVRAVGEGVDRWGTGDRVMTGWDPGCSACDPCRAGRTALCLDQPTPGTTEFQGAFAGFVLVDQRSLLAVPDGLSLRHAALAEPLAVAVNGIRRSGVMAGQRALVSGAGPIGSLTLAALLASGVDDVGVVEPGEARAELARRLGATVVKRPDDLDVPSIAEPGRIVDDAYDVVIETSGHRSAVEAGLAQLERMGTLVIVGSGIDPPHLDPNRILLNELVVTGSFAADEAGFTRSLELLTTEGFPTEVLLHPNDVGLNDLLDTMHDLARGEIAAKALVDPHLEVPTR